MSAADSNEPPFVDEHEVAVNADPVATWRALVAVAAGTTGGPAAERYARLIRCEPAVAEGPPERVGSAIVGFRVTDSAAGERYRLAGRHHFSNYVLDFLVEPRGAGSTIRARTYAEFPGRLGRLYRAAVIGTRMHVLVTNRMLRAARARAER
ncbi:hypothetical protein HJD18_00370 [Thermoleophilia bacterium SCSIO 60948]|nr:hypothetical protein HJD18_00370 [Thermoleophilia bacterium SCSIO 60948]